MSKRVQIDPIPVDTMIFSDDNVMDEKEMLMDPRSRTPSSHFQALSDDPDSVYPQIGNTICLDSGTYNIRIGESGNDTPDFIIPTADFDTIQIQDDQPIICGQINKWSEIEKIWLDLIENKMKFDPTEHPIVSTEPHDISKKNREQMCETLFEAIQCPAFYCAPSSLFSLFSTGRTSGVVLDFAYDTSRIVPIYEGYVLQFNSNTFNNFGGQHINNELANLLEKSNNISKMQNFDMKCLESIKRSICCMRLKGSKMKELSNASNQSYKLPDGQVITFKNYEFVKCTEFMFEDFNGSTFAEYMYQSIMKCDKQSYKEMFNNIVMCGGTSTLRGFKLRMKSEISDVIFDNADTPKQQYNVHIAQPVNKELSAWIGASIFSSLPSFARALITIQEYTECGARVVHHKCF